MKGYFYMNKEEKEYINYQKFLKKVARLTEYAHTKRIFSRMEAQEKKKNELRKTENAKKKKKSSEEID